MLHIHGDEEKKKKKKKTRRREEEKKFSTRATKALAPSSPYILLGQKFVHRQTSSQLLIYGLLKNTKRRRKVILELGVCVCFRVCVWLMFDNKYIVA